MPRILIADDSRFQLALLSKGLEAKGFKVTSAEDTVQASMIALRSKPDAIVLDIGMPGGSGLEVIKRLKRSSKTRKIPIVIATADPNAREAAMALGASEFFCKPVDLNQLAEKLSELCPSDSRKDEREIEPPMASAAVPSEEICSSENHDKPEPEGESKPLRSWREILRELGQKDFQGGTR